MRALVAVFYNVENLFDTIDDPIINDNEFLPNAKKHWSTRKYKRKLKNIASVIHRIHSDTNHIPFIVGLAEVENRSVLQDLINQDELRDYNFDYVHFDSRDARGIDVSLLFNKSLIEILLSKTFPIDIQQNDLCIKYHMQNCSNISLYKIKFLTISENSLNIFKKENL